MLSTTNPPGPCVLLGLCNRVQGRASRRQQRLHLSLALPQEAGTAAAKYPVKYPAPGTCHEVTRSETSP